jgi:hypothetical protein
MIKILPIKAGGKISSSENFHVYGIYWHEGSDV